MRKVWIVLLIVVIAVQMAQAKETEMNIWLQHADTSIENVKANNAEDAVRAFNNFDWKKEQEKQKQMGASQSVPPSFGFGAWGDERFMNIIPKGENNVEVLYVKTKTVPKKILGFIPSTSETNEQFLGENLTHGQVEEIIRAYIANDEATIIKYCNK